MLFFSEQSKFSHLNKDSQIFTGKYFSISVCLFPLKNRKAYFVINYPAHNKPWATPQILLKAISYHLVGQKLLIRNQGNSTFPPSVAVPENCRLVGGHPAHHCTGNITEKPELLEQNVVLNSVCGRFGFHGPGDKEKQAAALKHKSNVWLMLVLLSPASSTSAWPQPKPCWSQRAWYPTLSVPLVLKGSSCTQTTT